MILAVIASTAAVADGDLSAADIFKTTSSSIADLTVLNSDHTVDFGTAFLVLGSDGLAETALHVVQDGIAARATFEDGQEYDVLGLVDKDEENDIALIRIDETGRKPLPLGLLPPDVGSKAYVIGAPEGLDFSISDGLISQIRRLDSKSTVYQFSCPASPGNSGGPVMDSHGNVIGVVSFQFEDGQNLNFAIPSSYIVHLKSTAPTKKWALMKIEQEEAIKAGETTKEAHVLEIATSETVYAIPGDVIRLKGHYSDSERPLDHSFLEKDRVRAGISTGILACQVFDTPTGSYEARPTSTPTSDDFSYDWTATAGDHSLRLGYITATGAKKIALTAHVVVLPTSPLNISPAVLSSVDDIKVSVSAQPSPSFVPTKLDVLLDDAPVATGVAGPPFTFTLPISKTKAGKHPLKLEVYDNSGARFEYSDKNAVDVPTRVTLSVPISAKVTTATPSIFVKATMGGGFHPDKIEYVLKPTDGGDERILSTVTTTPFDGHLDLTSSKSGSYMVHAVAYADKSTYESDNYPITVQNVLDDAMTKDGKSQTATPGKLTWGQLNDKLANLVGSYLLGQPAGNNGKRWGLVQVIHARQPDPSVNVYLVAGVINTPTASNVHTVYSVDIDREVVTDTHKPW